MGYTLQAEYRLNPRFSQKSASGDFFDYPNRSTRVDCLPVQQPCREKSPTTTKSTSGDTFFRHYDPLTAKWWSADPIAEDGGLNLYGYVLNNPINYWDPLGLKWYHDAAVGALEAAGGGLAMAAGFADTATFGLTSKVSNKLNDAFYGEGTGDAVDKQMECSKANKIGKFAGNFVPGSSAAAGAARLAGPGSKLLGKGSRLFGRGERHGHKGITNRGKVRFGWGWKGNRSNGRDVFRASWSKKGNRSWLNHLDYDAAGLASQAGLGALAAGDALMNSGESGSGNCD